jgi:hypothetical protein
VRRAVVNVGTGRYQEASNRLGRNLELFDSEAQFCNWSEIPKEWPSHKEKPYAFKAYALWSAALTADLLLWCDSAIVPIRSLTPLWKRIEEDGYWIPKNGWTNYEWTADSAYADLFPERSIEEAREVNKTFPQIVATAFGFNLQHPIGKVFLDEYFRLAKTNAFCGPWTNTNYEHAEDWKQDKGRMGPCGPSDVIGHRHDQTAASVIAWRLGMKLEQCPGVFAYPPGDENTILLAVGA